MISVGRRGCIFPAIIKLNTKTSMTCFLLFARYQFNNADICFAAVVNCGRDDPDRGAVGAVPQPQLAIGECHCQRIRMNHFSASNTAWHSGTLYFCDIRGWNHSTNQLRNSIKKRVKVLLLKSNQIPFRKLSAEVMFDWLENKSILANNQYTITSGC